VLREGQEEGMGVLIKRNDGAARRLWQRRWQSEVAVGARLLWNMGAELEEQR
jgi:hypothetical protein